MLCHAMPSHATPNGDACLWAKRLAVKALLWPAGRMAAMWTFNNQVSHV